MTYCAFPRFSPKEEVDWRAERVEMPAERRLDFPVDDLGSRIWGFISRFWTDVTVRGGKGERFFCGCGQCVYFIV